MTCFFLIIFFLNLIRYGDNKVYLTLNNGQIYIFKRDINNSNNIY